jgi:hypothetical protein
MPKPGTFYHPRDTWSSTLAEAEEHARYHAEDDGPERDYDYDWMEDDECEDDECEDDECRCRGGE